MHKQIFIQSQQHIIPIDTADIILVEASGHYSSLKTAEKTYLVRTSIRKLEAMLLPFGFIRIHRKFIVPISQITQVERKRVVLGNRYLPIGLSYHKNFLEQLNILQ